MKTNIKGVGVALITPFNDNGDVDFEALERLLDRVAAGGADYLVVLGTTAETPTLSAAEKEAVTKFIVSKNGGRMPVVIGISGNCTAEVVDHIRHFDFTGTTSLRRREFTSITRRLPGCRPVRWSCTIFRVAPA